MFQWTLLIFFISPLMAYESNLKPILLNQEDWASFDTKDGIRLNPLSNLRATTRMGEKGNIQITDYVGKHKASNFTYSATVKRESGKVKEVVEIYSDTVNEKNRPLYKAQVIRLGQYSRLKSMTSCQGELTKKQVTGNLTRFQIQEGEEKIILDLRCHTTNEEICEGVQAAEHYADNTRNPAYIANYFQDKYSDDSFYKQNEIDYTAQITSAAPPGGRANLVWPKNPLFFQYTGISTAIPLTTTEGQKIAKKCAELVAFYKPNPEDGTELADESARIANASNIEKDKYKSLNEKYDEQLKYHDRISDSNKSTSLGR